MNETVPRSSAERYSRATRFALAFSLAILLGSAIQVAYRFFLPTDGWWSEEDLDGTYWDYYGNLVGADSALRPGDRLVGVEGQPLDSYNTGQISISWQAGNEVNYDITRGDQPLRIAVPLTHWTPRALFRTIFVNPSGSLSALGVSVLVVVGFMAFFKRPEDPAARALLIFVSALGAKEISGLVPDGFYTRLFPVARVTTTFYSYFIYGTLLMPALLAFTLVFPRPKPIVQRYPWLAYAPFLFGAVILAGLMLFPDAWPIGWGGTLLMVIAAIFSLIHSALTMHDAISRAQLLWAIGGFVLGLSLFFLNFPSAFGWVSPEWASRLSVIANLGIPVMGLGLTMAVLRYRLFDIEVIIRRTTSYAILTALLALVYFGSIVVLQQLLTPFTGDSDVAVVLSTLLIAALFLPLRRRVQDVIDRRFFRRKYNAEKVLAQFAATVRDETDLDALTAELMRVIQETMEPEHVSVWIRPLDMPRRGGAGDLN